MAKLRAVSVSVATATDPIPCSGCDEWGPGFVIDAGPVLSTTLELCGDCTRALYELLGSFPEIAVTVAVPAGPIAVPSIVLDPKALEASRARVLEHWSASELLDALAGVAAEHRAVMEALGLTIDATPEDAIETIRALRGECVCIPGLPIMAGCPKHDRS